MEEAQQDNDKLLYKDEDYNKVVLNHDGRIGIQFGGDSISFTMEDWVMIGKKAEQDHLDYYEEMYKEHGGRENG